VNTELNPFVKSDSLSDYKKMPCLFCPIIFTVCLS